MCIGNDAGTGDSMSVNFTPDGQEIYGPLPDRECHVCFRDPRVRDPSATAYPLKSCKSCKNSDRYCDTHCQGIGWNEHKALCEKTCSWCKTIGIGKLPKCPCKQRRYCSAPCQSLDWYEGATGHCSHRSECSFPRRETISRVAYPPRMQQYLTLYDGMTRNTTRLPWAHIGTHTNTAMQQYFMTGGTTRVPDIDEVSDIDEELWM